MSLNIRRKLITGPTVEPVTPYELQLHTVIDEPDVDEDVYLESLIRRARARFEYHTGRALVVQDWELSLTGFVSDIPLSMPPVREVLSVKYIDATGVEQTVPPADYTLSDYGLVPSLVPAFGKAWPSAAFTNNAVKIRLRCGHAALIDGEAKIDPASIIDLGKYELAKQAIMILAADWYTNREDTAPIQLYHAPNAYRALCHELTVDVL